MSCTCSTVAIARPMHRSSVERMEIRLYTPSLRKTERCLGLGVFRWPAWLQRNAGGIIRSRIRRPESPRGGPSIAVGTNTEDVAQPDISALHQALKGGFKEADNNDEQHLQIANRRNLLLGFGAFPLAGIRRRPTFRTGDNSHPITQPP